MKPSSQFARAAVEQIVRELAPEALTAATHALERGRSTFRTTTNVTKDSRELDEITISFYAHIVGRQVIDDALRAEAFDVRARAFSGKHKYARALAAKADAGIPAVLDRMTDQLRRECRDSRTQMIVDRYVTVFGFTDRVAIVDALKERYQALLDDEVLNIASEDLADEPQPLVQACATIEFSMRYTFTCL